MGLISSKRIARLTIGVPLIASAVALSGCMGSPTYGTGKTANRQLVEDVTGVLSFGTQKRRDPINYSPRSELVKPAEGDQVALVAPQDNLTTAGNGAWPESPEARLARIKADATANEGNPNYRSPVIKDIDPDDDLNDGSAVLDPERAGAATPSPVQREKFRAAVKANNQGDPNTRKFLSEPPTTYRAAEASAATGEMGEPEWKKEREARKKARKKGTGGLRSLWPF
ncbi:MAG TPA: hypothetical protein VMF90_04190 [Rhizobiaceae bacterium]|nr:hypothetical protein [Rhizobiaceae bacterium]